MSAKERMTYLLRHGRNSKDRNECLRKSIQLIDTTDSPLTKLYRAKEFGIRHKDPLVWLNLVLALYDQGKDIFGFPDLPLEVRNALSESKKPVLDPKHQPDPKADLFAAAVEKEMTDRKLFNAHPVHDVSPSVGPTPPGSAVA